MIYVNGYYEFHELFNADHTGAYCITDKNAPHGRAYEFKWSLSVNMLSEDYIDSYISDTTEEISIDGDVLKIFKDGDWTIYNRKKRFYNNPIICKA